MYPVRLSFSHKLTEAEMSTYKQIDPEQNEKMKLLLSATLILSPAIGTIETIH